MRFFYPYSDKKSALSKISAHINLIIFGFAWLKIALAALPIIGVQKVIFSCAWKVNYIPNLQIEGSLFYLQG